MVRALGVALALCCLFAAGCGESGPKRYQVSGDVNFKKKPVKMAQSVFVPTTASPVLLKLSMANTTSLPRVDCRKANTK